MKPEIEGTVPIRSSVEGFLEGFRQKVVTGLLHSRRSRYVVGATGPNHLEVHAADWWTATNVGLNRIELSQPEPGTIHYRVRYWRWAWYAIGLSGALGLIGGVLLLSLDVRGYLADHPASRVPGLSVEQNLLVAWLMIAFWGFVWPWILIALHKGPLRRLVTSLITDVDASIR